MGEGDPPLGPEVDTRDSTTTEMATVGHSFCIDIGCHAGRSFVIHNRIYSCLCSRPVRMVQTLLQKQSKRIE